MTIRPASDRSLLISFAEKSRWNRISLVSRLTHALEGARGVLNLHPAFTSVLIDFDPRRHTHDDIETLARERFAAAGARDAGAAANCIEIPVQFGGDAGPDLDDVARHAGISPESVVEKFAAAEYVVYFVGFATCFPYLGGLPPELATPRLSAPRKTCAGGQRGDRRTRRRGCTRSRLPEAGD